MVMYNAISATKANRLYWLGRYTERVYISLHLLRRYYDKMIDGEPKEYEEYYQKLDIDNPYPDTESFRIGYMYDDKNPCSIISGLNAANDNAIVLREEIKSETLSYIQLSLTHTQRAAQKQNPNVTDMQQVTDYLLAFWGSVDERVFDERIRHFLKIGKLVEHIDMLIRFDYPYYRVREAYDRLKRNAESEENVFDPVMLAHLEDLLLKSQYEKRTGDYKARVLKYLNHLVLL